MRSSLPIWISVTIKIGILHPFYLDFCRKETFVVKDASLNTEGYHHSCVLSDISVFSNHNMTFQ